MATSGKPTFLDSKAALWTGRGLTSLIALFLSFDGAAKVAQEPHVMEANARLGYPGSVIPGLGVVLIACAVAYAIPRTSVLGAILLTAWLGGAVATKVRVGEPVLFEVLFGVAVWAGVFLRDARLRALVPLRTPAPPAATHEEHEAPEQAAHAGAR
jgi:hypothetical protein